MKTSGVIAAGNALTAEAAEGVLREGGNAYDAALAGFAMACVAEPVLASLGGGGFLLAQPASDRPRLYDFFVHTPRVRKPVEDLDFRPILADFGTAQQEFHIGLGSVAVPGAVRGLFEIHRDLATLPMRDLVAPAVERAVRGVTLNAFQGYLLRVVEAIYGDNPQARALYGSRERPGHLLGEGERLVQPELADTLEALAHEGDDLFYRGEIAQVIAGDMSGHGQLASADLARYRVQRYEPLRVDYHGARLLMNPPPSSGGVLVGFALKLLDPEEVAPRGFGSWSYLSLLAQVMALSGEARAEAQLDEDAPHPDPDRLLDPELLALYRARVGNRARSRSGTTQISIIDGRGDIASLSVSNGEGSAYVVPGTGIMMNNMLGEEDLNPGGFQRWPADRRLTSMMAPTVATRADGTVIATGSGGSNRIRSAISQVLVNLIDFGMRTEEAVLAPRIHFERGLLSIEGGFAPPCVRDLIRGFPRHQLWDERNMFFGGAHTAALGPGGFEGAGDPRRGGVSVTVAR